GPTGTNILFGKSLVVDAKTSGHRPKEVYLTAFPPGHPEQATTLPMFDKGGAGYSQLIDNVRTDLLVYVHTKDGHSLSKQVHVGVILIPQLEHTFVKITSPAYTGLKPEEKAYEFKGVQALEGSKVRFRLQSNRPLRNGLLEISGGDAAPQRITLTNTTENEVAGTFVAKESGRLRFSIIDAAGNPSIGDNEGALTVTYDLPPEVRIVEPESDVFVAEDFKLQVHVEANDDYGVRTLRLHRGLDDQFSTPRVTTNAAVVRDMTEMEQFDFAKLGVKPGDVVSLFAEAVDTAPQPHIARSQTLHVQIISVEDYNNYLREQNDISDAKDKYDALADNLQQLIDEQKKLGDEAEKL
ncbi:MAG TPA: hypothetical protein VN516_08175, partial [Candidatus Baltobacteraceae bacterium]|nr:hypothetical protein [Candidatus Baltobacteraceae bacterium]